MSGMAKVEHDNLTFPQLIENIGFWRQPTRLLSPTAAAFVRSALVRHWRAGLCHRHGVLARPGATSAKQGVALENQVWARE